MNDSRIYQAQEALKHWQQKLNMHDWALSVELVEFNRTDYIQTGDFRVESNKKAIILISKTPTDKDISKVVLHELIHVLLWKMDSWCEDKVGAKNRDEYLGLLEDTVGDLTERIFVKQRDGN